MIIKKPRVKVSSNSVAKFHKYNRHKTSRTLKMKAASFYFPKDNKKRPQGDDAHFVSNSKNTVGVADGVGGWAKKGVDAGKYARNLMENCVLALEDEAKGAVNPARILKEAYCNTHDKGSLTACVMALNGNFLDYANIGDSGFMVFRDKKMVYKSPVQQHGFNYPYQMGNPSSDTPNSAYEDRFTVEDGDFVVVGSDGLLDNLYPSEILEALEEENKEPEELAWKIAECALFNSLDEDYISPFARAAQMAGKYHEGGKYDDITVIVAKIELVLTV